MSIQPFAAAPAEEPDESVDLDRLVFLEGLYPWIRMWSKRCGFDEEFTRSQLVEAHRSEAPSTAIYRSSSMDRWMLLEDILPEAYETRLYVLGYATSYNLAIPPQVLKVWLDPHAHRPSVTVFGESMS